MKKKIAWVISLVICLTTLNACTSDGYIVDILPTVEVMMDPLCPVEPTSDNTNEITEPSENINTTPEEQDATEPTEEIGVEEIKWKSLGTFRITAYCSCRKCCGDYAVGRPTDENGDEIVYTASGEIAQAGVTIAVDPKVIPYGTQVIINDHTYTAQDAGLSIKGNRIDVYFDNHSDAWDFGVKFVEVFTELYNQEETK